MSLSQLGKVTARTLKRTLPLKRRLCRRAFKLLIHICFAVNLFYVVQQYFDYEIITQSVTRPATRTTAFTLLIAHYLSPGAYSFEKDGRLSREFLPQVVDTTWLRDPITLEWKNYSSTYLANVTKIYLIGKEIFLGIRFKHVFTQLGLEASGSNHVALLDLKARAHALSLAGDIRKLSNSKIKENAVGLYKGQNLLLTLQTENIRSLPAPYLSDCINYSDYGFVNQWHCSSACIQQKYVRKYHSRSSEFAAVDIEETSTPVDSIPHTLSESAQFVETETEYCDKLCRKTDCLKRAVKSKPTTYLTRKKNVTRMSVNAASQETNIVYLAKQSVSIFIMYAGNVVSLWYGYSFVDLTALVTRVCQMLKQRFLIG
ncbi:hypothetical protein HDE_09588 [Halotydeus destructor]|nr:hypothetical protein HDE_09588 [Halotydeus destructor]